MIFPDRPKWRTVYEIRHPDRKGAVFVRRMNWHAWGPKSGFGYHEELAIDDQNFANEVFDLIQKACEYWYVEDDRYTPMEASDLFKVDDGEVRRRIAKIQNGELHREAVRHSAHFPDASGEYPLNELPFELQRALISQLDKMKAEWRYKVLGVYVSNRDGNADRVKTMLAPDA